MPTESKNREATGERDPRYAEWRAKRPGDFISLYWLEYRRIEGAKVFRDWPLVELVSVVLPIVVAPNEVEADALQTAMDSRALTVERYRALSTRLPFPFFFTICDPAFQDFLVQRLSPPPREPGRATREQFVKHAMQQRWNGDKEDFRLLSKKLDPYSVWHRQVVPSSAYLMDVDYLELRAERPVAVIEVTQAYTDDLPYFVFAYMSRSFVQMSALIAVAEAAGVHAYLVVPSPDLRRFLVVPITRAWVEACDDWDRERKGRAAALIKENVEKREADSLACRDAFSKFEAQFRKTLQAEGNRELTEAQYEQWLGSLVTGQ